MALNLKPQVRNDSAFTLIEVLFAMSLAAITLTALMAGTSFSFDTVKFAREDLRATQIMAQRMELVRLYTWDQLHDTNYLSTNQFQDYFDPNSTNSGIIYSGSYSLQSFPYTNTYGTNIQVVRVSLRWTNNLRIVSREMYTLVSSNGLQNYIIQ